MTTKECGENRCVICQNGENNLWRILWMKVFQNTGTHPRLLLVSQLRKVVSGKHSIKTQLPKDRNCDICMRTKISKAPCRKCTGTVIADHKVLSEGWESRNSHRYAVVVQDSATQWIQSYPRKIKTSQETERSLQKFLEPNRNPKVIYTDNSLEFGKACEDLSWNHCTSTPHRSETNGIAERAVRRVKEGTSAVLMQSGLDEKWCADSMECHCYLRHIQDVLSDGKTPFESRFGMPIDGPVIPFWAMVEYYPISAKDMSRLHQFGPQVLPGVFFHYVLHAVRIWKGDIMVADIEELEKMDASEIRAERLTAKEVLTPMSGEKFIFPIADGTVRLSGGSGSENIHLNPGSPDRGEEQGHLPRESDGSSSTPFHDSSLYDGEARNDFWSISGNFICRHHVEPRVKLYVPRGESFLIPLKWIDVTRTASTSLNVNAGESIDDYWNVDEDRDLSDTRTSFTRFTILDEIPTDGYSWSGKRLTRKQTTSGPDTLWPEIWEDMSAASKRKEKQKWAIENPKLDHARRLRAIYFIDPADAEFKETILEKQEKVESSDASNNALQDQKTRVQGDL